METTEKIVESYFRYCKKALTYADVKYLEGNNRQMDIMAYSHLLKTFWHIESSVSINERFALRTEQLEERMKQKFLGAVKTDTKGKQSFKNALSETYRTLLGTDWGSVVRVYVQWYYPEPDQLPALARRMAEALEVKEDRFLFLSLRDDILVELDQTVGTSKYSDDILRLLSILKESREQGRRANKKNQQN